MIAALAIALPLAAQTLPEVIKADSVILGQHLKLSDWEREHLAETQVQPSYDNPEYESQGLWCAATSATISLAGGLSVSRLALFYIPSSLSALPSRPDPTLKNQCELGSFVYQLDKAPNLKQLINDSAQELGAAWGAAEVLAPRDRQRFGWGSGYWNPYYRWSLRTGTAVVAFDPKGPPEVPPSAPPRGLAILRGGEVPERLLTENSFTVAAPDQPSVLAEAVKLAALPTPSPDSVEGIVSWMRAAHDLPAPRRAAALLVADIATRSVLLETPAARPRLESLGAKFTEVAGESDYARNWLAEAERLALVGSGTGPAADLVHMERLDSPCMFEGASDWHAPLIAYGEKVLRGPLGARWTPYVHYILARASELSSDRMTAVAHYQAYIGGKPAGSGVRFASEESFRLLAGLPPYPIHFGCGLE